MDSTIEDLKLYTLNEVEKRWVESIENIEIKEYIKNLLVLNRFCLMKDKCNNTYYYGEDQGGFIQILVEESILIKVQSDIEQRKKVKLEPLIVTQTFKNIKQFHFENKKAFKKILLKVLKNNEKIKKATERREKVMASCNEATRLVKNIKDPLNNDPIPVFLSVDVEAYYKDQSAILELGWSTYDFDAKTLNTRHIIIQEHTHLNNEKIGMNCGGKFLFGGSQILSIEEAIYEFQRELNKFDSICLIGHSVHSELKYFKRMGITVNYDYLFDTNDFYKFETGCNTCISLSKLCERLNIEVRDAHNAGNDAHYTLLAFLKMIDIIPRDISFYSSV